MVQRHFRAHRARKAALAMGDRERVGLRCSLDCSHMLVVSYSRRLLQQPSASHARWDHGEMNHCSDRNACQRPCYVRTSASILRRRLRRLVGRSALWRRRRQRCRRSRPPTWPGPAAHSSWLLWTAWRRAFWPMRPTRTTASLPSWPVQQMYMGNADKFVSGGGGGRGALLAADVIVPSSPP